MTATAVRAEFAVVHVISTMAIPTIAVDRRDFVQGDSVAIVAGNADVSPLERELGLCGVIESPDVPGDRVVAGVAAILEISAVRVVFTMTGNAAALFAGEYRRCMTTVAILLFVHAK